MSPDNPQKREKFHFLEGCWTGAVVWHNLQFRAQTGSRQQISTDQKNDFSIFVFLYFCISVISYFCTFCAWSAHPHGPTCYSWSRPAGSSANINGSKIYSSWKQSKEPGQNQNNVKHFYFCDIWLETKMGNRKYIFYPQTLYCMILGWYILSSTENLFDLAKKTFSRNPCERCPTKILPYTYFFVIISHG